MLLIISHIEYISSACVLEKSEKRQIGNMRKAPFNADALGIL